MDPRAVHHSYSGPQRAVPDDWRDSRDIERVPGQGYAPRYFRCVSARCLALVTDGQTLLGGCMCGGVKLTPAGMLSVEELIGLKRGDYPLTQREAELIQPMADCVVTSVI